MIIINPGHGGKDPGATNNGLIEKNYTLLMSLYQYERFKQLCIPVKITRDIDITLGNVERASLVKNSGAIYCIDNHINAAESTNAQGVEVIHSIYNNGQLAHKIVEALANEGIPLRAKPVYCKQHPSRSDWDYYFMHRLTGKVSTNIIEYDFITNTEGAKRIRDNWQRYAEAVVKVYCIELGYPYRGPKEELKLDEKIKVILHGKKIEVEGKFIENKNYVPIRILEQLGYKVDWDGENVLVDYKGE